MNSGHFFGVDDEKLGHFSVAVGSAHRQLEMVPISGEGVFPLDVEAWILNERWPEITLHFQVVDDAPALVVLKVERMTANRRVPLQVVRDIEGLPPLGRLLNVVIKEVAAWASAQESGRAQPDFHDIKLGEKVAARRRKRHVINDELLSTVAEVVRTDMSGAPRQALREQIGCSLRTASRWIALARERGFLEVGQTARDVD
jgi:hypothetical protein